jgi:hypothetical protein
MLSWNAFQLFHPIGGESATPSPLAGWVSHDVSHCPVASLPLPA